MSDNVDTLLTQIQEQIDGGKKLGRLRMVDPQELQDLLESVRAALPNTIERAKEIVADRAGILERARNEADMTVSEAQRRAADTEADAEARVAVIVQNARDRVLQHRAEGEQIMEDAQAEAARLVAEHTITQNAREQAEQMLRQTRAAADKLDGESRQRAQQLIDEAQGYSQELRRRAEEWGMQYTTGVRTVVEEIVNEAEEILASSLTHVRSTQKRLQTTMSKSAAPPAFNAPEEPRVF